MNQFARVLSFVICYVLLQLSALTFGMVHSKLQIAQTEYNITLVGPCYVYINTIEIIIT